MTTPHSRYTYYKTPNKKWKGMSSPFFRIYPQLGRAGGGQATVSHLRKKNRLSKDPRPSFLLPNGGSRRHSPFGRGKWYLPLPRPFLVWLRRLGPSSQSASAVLRGWKRTRDPEESAVEYQFRKFPESHPGEFDERDIEREERRRGVNVIYFKEFQDFSVCETAVLSRSPARLSQRGNR